MRVAKEKRLMMLKPSQIKYPPDFKTDYSRLQLNSLMGSISANGIIEPILVKKEKGGTYLLLSGGKRLYCAKAVGLRRIPCLVCRVDSLTGSIYRLLPNLCRYETPFLEHARLIKYIMDEGNLTVKETAARLGISPCAVENKLRLLSLSSTVRGQIKNFNLSENSARILSRLTPENQEILISKITDSSFAARQLEEEISRLLTDEVEEENILFEEEPQEIKVKRKSAVMDKRFLKNSLLRLVSSADEAGIKATFRTVETEKYTEYKIRIAKKNVPCFEQLKIV